MSFGGYTRTTWFVVLGVMLTCMWGFDKPEWAAYVGSLAIVFHKSNCRVDVLTSLPLRPSTAPMD
jgi:hypothetical protein